MKSRACEALLRLPHRGLPIPSDRELPRQLRGGIQDHRPDLIAGWQIGVEHGPDRWKKVWHDDIVFARSGADANVTTDTQDAPAFSRYRGRIGQVVIDL
jgi:hypothetical protein